MKLVVFGANGRVGRHLVAQALEAGHHVTAFVRDPASVTATDDRLRVVAGDVRDGAAVDGAVRGQDAILSAIGHRDRRAVEGLYSTAAKNYARAIAASTTVRVIAVSAFVADSAPRAGFAFRTFIRPLLLEDVFRDLEAAEAAYRASGVDFTTVRASRLTDGPRTGRYRSGIGLAGNVFSHVSRADVAEFMLRELVRGDFRRASPEILS